MIIKETTIANNNTIYKFYSDKGVYIKNTENGTLWSTVFTSIDYDFVETDTPIDEESE